MRAKTKNLEQHGAFEVTFFLYTDFNDFLEFSLYMDKVKPRYWEDPNWIQAYGEANLDYIKQNDYIIVYPQNKVFLYTEKEFTDRFKII